MGGVASEMSLKTSLTNPESDLFHIMAAFKDLSLSSLEKAWENLASGPRYLLVRQMCTIEQFPRFDEMHICVWYRNDGNPDTTSNRR